MKLTNKNHKKKNNSILFLIPSLIGVAVFYVLPFLVVIYFSFLDNPISKEFVGTYNYTKLLSNTAFKLASKNTAFFSMTAVPLAVVLGLLLALMLDSNLQFHSFLRSAFLTPLMVPTASIVLVFTVLFDYNGMVNNVLASMGYEVVDWLKSDKGMVVVTTLFLWKNTGYNMVLFLSALGSVPGEYIEAAKLDGAGVLKIFREIKLRYIAPMLVFTTLFSTINSFKVFREVYLLTGDYPYEALYTLQHYMNNTFASADYQKLSTAAIYMCLLMIVITFIMFKLERHFSKDIEED